MLTRRIVVFSPQDEFLFELSNNDVFSAKEVEEINGEHSLTIVTTRKLEKEQRILTKDATEKWREYVVMGSDGSHDSNQRPFGTYACVWSLQHDFKLFGVDDVIGLDSPVTASIALGKILDNTARWSKGTVTRSSNSGADMTQRDGWDAMQLLIANWGGEVDVTINVSNEKISARKVDLYEALGNQNATRRFDYRRDLAYMRRKVEETPIACRIRPYGKGERNIDGIDVKITIAEVNDGKDYLQNDAMASQLRLPDGRGGWEYPTLNVTNTSIDDPEELLEWGQSVLEDYTTPKATYESSVMQFVEAGMSAEGVALGDKTQCVDRDFDPDGGVRIESRVRKIANNLLDPSLTELTLGDAKETFLLATFEAAIESINSSIRELNHGAQATEEYLNNLLDHINEEINATGGYTYLVPGIGAITYDKAVSDPSVGSEASQATEMRGGTLRFANSRTSSGGWKWTNVITADGYIALAATIARITTGFVGNAGTGTYIDLDNNTASFGPKSGYHLTIDTDGIRLWYASELIGYFLNSSAQIGENGHAHVTIDDGGMELYNGSNNRYFQVSDLTALGYTVTERLESGTTYTYTAKHAVLRTTISGVSYPRVFAHYRYNSSSGTVYYQSQISSSGWSLSNRTFTIDPSYLDKTHSGYSVTTYAFSFQFQTSDVISQAFTFGTRNSNNVLEFGGLSFTSGMSNIAKGETSSAFGKGLTANSDCQHVFGRYNIQDSNGNYVLIIGNGTSSSSPSNALTLTWDGALWIPNSFTAKSISLTDPVPISSGGTGQRLLISITDESTLLTHDSATTISSVQYKQWGKVATFYLSYTCTGTFNPDSSGWVSPHITVCTLNSGYRPASNTRGIGSGRGGNYSLETNGKINLSSYYLGYSTPQTSHSESVTFTYILPN